MNSILVILSTILIIGGISSAYSESISSQLERRLPYDQIQCDKLDHVFIGAHITGSYACIHKKVAEEFKIPSFYNVTIGDRFGMIRYSNMTFEYNSTQNIVTEDFNFKKTDILESNKTNLLTNIGDAILPDGPILDYYQHFWPQYTMIFPKQVQVGEPFNVVLDYTFVLPSIEYVNNTGIEVWGNNSELQCPASKCETHSLYQCILNGCYGYNFDIVTSPNVDLLNESNYVLGKVFHGKYDAEYIVEDKFNVVDLTVDKYRNHGYVLRPYNNTYPQQENFTFVINTPTTDNYGIIAIGHQIREHNSLFHFYIAPNNTVYLTTSSDYAPWEGWNNLKKPILNYGYYPPFIFVHPMGDIPFMKDFIQKNYPDADIEQKLRDMDQPEEIIEQFFSVYPELQKKSPQTCISCTQISEQIPSPKKQIDNGVEPHDVVCRDDLILVDRGMNNIACVKKTTAQKMNWEIINNTLVEKSNIVKNNEIDVVFETITSTYNSNGHGIGSSFLTPMTTFTFPRNVTVGETFFINYTIDWVDENGTLLYPTLYSDGSNAYFIPLIFATNEFSVLNNSFNLFRVMADKNASHMLAFYTGNPISFSNKTITDSIEIQLTENMMYTLDTMYIFAGRLLQLQLIDNNNSIELISRSELGEDKFYSHFENMDANRYRIPVFFDNDAQKWYKDNNIELDTLPNGFPNYIPKTTNLPTAFNSLNAVTNSIGSQEQLYIPQAHWEKFSEYLRSVEKYENIQITREWLMGENLSEDFVNDFFVAYPEFLIH